MKIDLEKGVGFEIGGEKGKDNSLSVRFFVDLMTNFQDLINKLAKNTISDAEAIDLNNFQLHITDFKHASAVPVFMFQKNPQGIIGNVIQQRKLVSRNAESVFQASSKNDYFKLKTEFEFPVVRNEVIEASYKFFKTFENSPVSVVNIQGGKIQQIYKLNKFPESVRRALVTRITDIQVESKEVYSAVARVTVTQTNEGIKRHLDKDQIFKGNKFSPAYQTEIITGVGKVYELNVPLTCTIDKEDDAFYIKCGLLDIIGCGVSIDDAESDLAEEFDFIYQRYSGTEDKKLSERLRKIKQILLAIVKSIH